MKKRIMTGNSEIEIEDTDSVERMRHRDTDGDGAVDDIDRILSPALRRGVMK